MPMIYLNSRDNVASMMDGKIKFEEVCSHKRRPPFSISFNGFKFFLRGSADRTFFRQFVTGHIAADLAYMIGFGFIPDDLIHGALIKFGVVGFRIPGLAECHRRRLLTLIFSVLDKLRVFIFTDRLLPLEGIEIGRASCRERVYCEV